MNLNTTDVFCDFVIQKSYNLNRVFATDNIDTQISLYTKRFNKCLNVCAPLVTKEVKRPFGLKMNENLKIS